MKSRSRVMIQAGAPAPAGSGSARRFAIGDREWLLVPASGERGGQWRWKRAGLLRRIWTLESERGVHLVLQEQSMFRRRWRAESTRAGWTIVSAWNGGARLSDDGDSVLLVYHPGWLFRGRIEPASGPDMTWRRRGFSRYTLESADGHELLALAHAPGFLNRDFLLTLSDEARTRADLLPLAALAARLAIRARQHHGH